MFIRFGGLRRAGSRNERRVGPYFFYQGRRAGQDGSCPYEFTSVDTVPLCRIFYPDLKELQAGYRCQPSELRISNITARLAPRLCRDFLQGSGNLKSGDHIDRLD